MNRFRMPAIAVAVVVSATGVAWADPITVRAGQRLTQATARFGQVDIIRQAQGSDTLSSTADASAAGTLMSATSTMVTNLADPLHWVGMATADTSFSTVGVDFANDVALSNFAVDFEVASRVSYRFDGTFNQSSTSSSAGLNSFAEALARLEPRFVAPFTSVFNVEAVNVTNLSQHPVFSGFLDRGLYTLFFRADSGQLTEDSAAATASGHADFKFTFDLAPADLPASPTPEPATVLLLGTGIAGAFGVRSRRNRAV